MVATMICVFASFVFRNKNRLTFYLETFLDFNGGNHNFCTCRFCGFKQILWVSFVFVLPCRARCAFALHSWWPGLLRLSKRRCRLGCSCKQGRPGPPETEAVYSWWPRLVASSRLACTASSGLGNDFTYSPARAWLDRRSWRRWLPSSARRLVSPRLQGFAWPGQ